MGKVDLVLILGKSIGKGVTGARFAPVPLLQIVTDSGAEAPNAMFGGELEGQCSSRGTLDTECPVEPVPFGVSNVALQIYDIVFDAIRHDVAAREAAVNVHDVLTCFRDVVL